MSSSEFDDGTSGAEDASKYERLDLREHILKRPENYIGSTQPVTGEIQWVIENNKMVTKEVTYVPGLYKIFDEVLVNAADNAQRDPPTRTIKVVINQQEGYISVWNDGKGIPVVQKLDEKSNEWIWVPEFIFGHLLTSSNFDDNVRRTTGGRNGFGAKLANIYSTKFLIDIISTDEDGAYVSYHQEFRNSMAEKDEPVITPVKDRKKQRSSTMITFYPNCALFGMDGGLDDDIIGIMKKRVWDVSGCLPSVAVWLNEERIPVRSFAEYCKLYLPKEDTPLIDCKVNDRWKVAVAASPEGLFQQVSFVNSVATLRGGTHVDLVTKQLTNYFCTALSNAKKKVSVKPNMAKQFLWVFVDALIENPAFDSQTKETLTTKPAEFGSTCELPESFLKKVKSATNIEDLIREYAQFRDQGLMKKLGGRKLARVHVAKLTEANEAGGKRSAQCTLILTEGDSAKGMAVTGLSVIGQDYYGVFPLRGKMLNTRDVSAAKLQKNEEIKNLMNIMALKPDQVFGEKGNASIKDLRYGSIMIMADQDQDGSHIKGLIINFIHSMWPSLIKQKGFLCEFITPIVKATKGKQVIAFYTLPEFVEWKKQNNDARGWTVKYYKGLATSDDDETKEYFSNFKRHKIDFKYDGDGDEERIRLAFSKKRADDRKEWLADLDPSVTYIGHDKDKITYSEFVDKELILFSNYANVRAIPSVVDGLKPGQRKILWVCLKNKINRELKVIQLSGKVSEESAYHHGEDSLSQTIVGMAQAFVGSNNINLLVPKGNFGSRLRGGQDAGSPRYIYTRLEGITRYLFHKDDDQLLEYLTDEGIPIEPKYYVPIIPMVLVNGAAGIGVGWSTSVPCYDPKVIIRNCIHKIRGEELEEMTPWYSGFQGEIEKHDNGTRWIVKGKAEIISDQQIDITELPIQIWTDDYKEFIDKMTIDPEKEKKTDKQKGKDAKAKEREAKRKEREEKRKAAQAKRAAKAKEKARKERESQGLAPEDEDETTEDTTKDSMTDDGGNDKLIGRRISSYRCHHTNNTVHFEIFVNEDQMANIRDKGLETFFRLTKNINSTNMTLFDPSGRLKQYKSAVEILDDFYKVRIDLYNDRKNALIEDLTEIMTRLSNQARFVKEFIEGTLKLLNEPRKNVLWTLKNRGYDLMADDKKLPKRVAEDAVVVEGEVDEEVREAEHEQDTQMATLQKGYNYLLSMKIWTLTREKYLKLLKQVEEAEAEVQRIKDMEPSQMWLNDLEELSKVYEQFEQLREDKRVQNVNDAEKARKKSKSKPVITKVKRAPAATKAEPKGDPGATRADVDSQADENDSKTKKKTAAAPKKAAARQKKTEDKKPAKPKAEPKAKAEPKPKASPKSKGQKKLDSFIVDDSEDELSGWSDHEEAVVELPKTRRATSTKTKDEILKTLKEDSEDSLSSDSEDEESDAWQDGDDE